jgi:hypothetical protein
MHGGLRARHSLAIQFATFAGSDVEAFYPIIDLEQAKCEMSGGMGEGMQSVGDWWMEGGMGIMDVGETAVVRVGAAVLPDTGCFQRCVVAPQKW